MSQLIVGARAPSNIALVKYMGKQEGTANIPENPSLSLTLSKMCSYVEITCGNNSNAGATNDEALWVAEPPLLWSAYSNLRLEVPRLEKEGSNRFLRHFERVRRAAPGILSKYDLSVSASKGSGTAGPYLIRSGNTFPLATGLASSASSFAALTLAAAMTCADDLQSFGIAWDSETELRRELAGLSRQGSGSSCRSFEGPWVGWDRERSFKMSARTVKLRHFVLIVSGDAKKVSSSTAHQLVKQSPLWKERAERARARFDRASKALSEGNLGDLARIAWSETWEMHSLFHTSAEPFSYWRPQTVDALQWFSHLMSEPEPPIVSMDAGPNLHLIVPVNKADCWRDLLIERYGRDSLYEDEPGDGAVPVRRS
jgi:diphosphomevalonate decarboxylase